MAKKKKTFYEEMVFDDAQLALDTMEECKEDLAKAKRGLSFALIATACSAIGWLLGPKIDILSLFILPAFVLSIVAYIIGGGFGTAIKWAWKLAIFGWICIPFPFDIVVGIFTMFIALLCFFFVPVLFVYMNYNQVKKDYAAAKKYLSYYKAKTQSAQTQTTSTSRTTSTGTRTYR